MLPKPKSIFDDMPEFAAAAAPVAAEPEPIVQRLEEDEVPAQAPIAAPFHDAAAEMERAEPMEPFTLDDDDMTEVPTGMQGERNIVRGAGPPANAISVSAPNTVMIKYLDVMQQISEKQFALMEWINDNSNPDLKGSSMMSLSASDVTPEMTKAASEEAFAAAKAEIMELFAKANTLKDQLHAMWHD